MNFHWPFFRKPAHTELAELRDRLIVAETKAVLIENALEAERSRRSRERRRDATDVKHAIAARAKAYSDRFAKLKEGEGPAFIAAAKNGGRG